MADNVTHFAQKPKEGEPWDVAIIGSGPASFTAAIYTTRGAASTLILGGEKWGGQLMLTTTVDNFPGFPEGVQGPDLMQRMKSQVERFGGEFVAKNVEAVDFEKRPFELLTGGTAYFAKSVIIATGADTKWLGIPGEKELIGKGVSSCAPCDAPFFKDKNVAVVGGGDAAMEEALVLTRYATMTTIIHRRDQFKASMAMQHKVFEHEKEGKIRIFWDTEVIEMIGKDKLESAILKTKLDSTFGKSLKEGKLSEFGGEQKKEEEGFLYWSLPTDGLFVAIGHIPATDLFSGRIETDDKGYVVRRKHMRTSIEDGVFVAGDVHDIHYRQAITAAGYGCMAGMDVLRFLNKDAPSW